MPFGRVESLFVTHTAVISNTNYTVSKDGYRPNRLEFPETHFRWHEFLGIEIGRPRLSLKCTLQKVRG